MKSSKVQFAVSLLGFLPLSALALPLQVLTSPTITSIGTPQYSGTGCAATNTSFTHSPDNKVISFIFDSFTANAGNGVQGQGKLSDTKNCTIRIPISLPANVRVAVAAADYRGFVSIPSGGMAQFTSRYYFKDKYGIVRQGPALRKAFKGPMTSTFEQETTTADSRKIYSGCGGSTDLYLSSGILIGTNAEKTAAQATVDSVDGTLDPQFAVNLTYEPCVTPINPPIVRYALPLPASRF